MKKHLNNIGKILQKFIKKYGFIRAYLSIKGVVSITNIGSLEINCMDEFDKLTVKEVKDIKSDLYMQIREYMISNGITTSISITTTMRSWACDDIIISYSINTHI